MPFNDDMPYDAFISHSSQDGEVALRLAGELEREGFVVWLDKREVLVGHNIVQEVDLGISQSRFLIVLLSRLSTESEWVRKEWTAAYVTEIESKDVVVLPVLVEPCSIPASLKTKRYADLTNWDSGIRDILDAMKGHSSVKTRRSRKPVQIRRGIVSDPVHFAVTAPGKPLSELFIGGVLFTSLPKAKFRNMSLLIQIGGRINAAVNLDREDAFMMEGLRLEDGNTWRWNDNGQAIPCMVLCVDMVSGEYSTYMLPTYDQVHRLLRRQRELIFLFLIEDGTGSDIMGVNLGSVGMSTLVLRNAHVSFDV